MYSPTGYLENIITSHLEAFVENLDSNIVSLGLWSGNINLKDLNIKKQIIPIGLRHNLLLEFGSISSLDISVPWTQLTSGKISLSIKNVIFIFRIKELDLRDSNDHSEFLKRRETWLGSKLEKIDQKLFDLLSNNVNIDKTGNGLNNRQTSKSLLDTLTSSFLSRILAGFEVTIEKASLLLIPPIYEYSSIQPYLVMNIDLIYLRRAPPPSNEEVIENSKLNISKEIQIKGLKVFLDCTDSSLSSVDTKYNPSIKNHTVLSKPSEPVVTNKFDFDTYSRMEYSELFKSIYEHCSSDNSNNNAILNQIDLNINFKLFQLFSDSASKKNLLNIYHFKLSVDVSPLHISINPSNVTILSNILALTSTANFRSQFSHYIPEEPLSSNNFKIWWKYLFSVFNHQKYYNKKNVLAAHIVKTSMKKEYFRTVSKIVSSSQKENSRINNDNYHVKLFGLPLDQLTLTEVNKKRLFQLIHVLSEQDIFEIHHDVLARYINNPNEMKNILSRIDKKYEANHSTFDITRLIKAKDENANDLQPGAISRYNPSLIHFDYELLIKANKCVLEIQPTVSSPILSLYLAFTEANAKLMHNEYLEVKLDIGGISAVFNDHTLFTLGTTEYGVYQHSSAISSTIKYHTNNNQDSKLVSNETFMNIEIYVGFLTLSLQLTAQQRHFLESINDIFDRKKLKLSHLNNLSNQYKHELNEFSNYLAKQTEDGDGIEDTQQSMLITQKMHLLEKSIASKSEDLKLILQSDNSQEIFLPGPISDAKMEYINYTLHKYSDTTLDVVNNLNILLSCNSTVIYFIDNNKPWNDYSGNHISIEIDKLELKTDSHLSSSSQSADSCFSNHEEQFHSFFEISKGQRVKNYSLSVLGIDIFLKHNLDHHHHHHHHHDHRHYDSGEISKAFPSQIPSSDRGKFVDNDSNLDMKNKDNNKKLNTASNKIKILKYKWNTKFLLTCSSFPSNPYTADFSVLIVSSPLDVSLIQQDIVKVVDSIMNFSQSLKPFIDQEPKARGVEESQSQSQANIRINNLAPLVKLRGSLLVDSVTLSILNKSSERSTNTVDLVFDIFSRYGDAYTYKNTRKYTYKLEKKLAKDRLYKLGIPRETIKVLCKDFINELSKFNLDDLIMNKNGIFSGGIHLYSTKCLELIQESNDATEQNKINSNNPISSLTLTLKNIQIDSCVLTYDQRSCVSFGEMIVYDYQYYPVFHLYSDMVRANDERFHDSFNTLFIGANGEVGVSNNLNASANSAFMNHHSHNAFSFVYQQQDSTYMWGVGRDISLFDYNKLDFNGQNNYLTPNIIDCKYSIDISNCRTLISAKSLSMVIDTLMYIYHQMQFTHLNHENEKSSISKPSKPLQNIKEFFTFNLSSMGLVLAHQEQLIMKIMLTDSVLHQEPVSQSVWMAVENIKALDLSEAGTHHPIILWVTNTRNKMPSSPHSKFGNENMHSGSRESKHHAIIASLTFKENSDCLLNIELNKFNICLLYRLINDIFEFKAEFISLINTANEKASDYKKQLLSSSKSCLSPDHHDADNLLKTLHGNSPLADKNAFLNVSNENHEINSFGSRSSSFSSYEDTPESSIYGSVESITPPYIDNVLNKDFSILKVAAESEYNATNSDKIIQESKFNFKVIISDFSLILPRNSYSEDLVALRMNYFRVSSLMTHEIFSVPSSPISLENDTFPITFDIKRNVWTQWQWSTMESPLDTNNAESCSQHSVPAQEVSDLNYYDTVEGIDDTSSVLSFKSSVTHIFKSAMATVEHDNNNDNNNDNDTTNNTDDENSDHKEKSYAEPTILRVNIELDGLDIYAYLESEHINETVHPIKQDFENEDYNDVFEFMPVVDSGLVYKNKSPNKFSKIQRSFVTPRASATWKKLSPNCFDLNIILDDIDKGVGLNILLVDSDKSPNPMELNVSMAELYLLESVYFDNVNEMSQFANESSSHSNQFKATYGKMVYQTDEYKEYMKNTPLFSKFVFYRSDLILNCFIDKEFFGESNYYSKHLSSLQELFHASVLDTESPIGFVQVKLKHVLSHSEWGNGIFKSILGVSSILVNDTRRGVSKGNTMISIGANSPSIKSSYSDPNFGIDISSETLDAVDLDIPFKMTYLSSSICPWASINIGLLDTNITTDKLSIIWQLSEFFSSYFKHPEFGHPSTLAYHIDNELPSPYYGMDIQCYFLNKNDISKICTFIDQTSFDSTNLSLSLHSGLYFQYAYDSAGLINMKVIATDARLSISRGISLRNLNLINSSNSNIESRNIIENLSLYYSYHFNKTLDSGNTIIHLGPILPSDISNILNTNIMSQVEILELYAINPSFEIKRTASNLNSTALISSYEDLLTSIKIIRSFLSTKNDESIKSHQSENDTVVNIKSSFFFSISNFQVILIDHIFGMHLPLLKAVVDQLEIYYNYDSNNVNANLDTTESYHFHEIDNSIISNWTKGTLHADFFNKNLKCWEPLFEPFLFQLVVEKSHVNGFGLSFRVENELHLNFTSVMFSTILDLIRVIESGKHVYDEKSKEKLYTTQQNWIDPINDYQDGGTIESRYVDPLKLTDKAAYSIQNLLGQSLRYQYFTGEESSFIIAHLDHNQRSLLNFIPTEASLINCKIVNEAFEFDRHSKKLSTNHSVKLQISGFKWLSNIQADSHGINFHEVEHLNTQLDYKQLIIEKKLLNAFNVASEVVSHNGGKMLRMRSVFSIKNNNFHAIDLFVKEIYNSNSESHHKEVPDSQEIYRIESGQTFYVPLALPFKSLLEDPSHESLGYIWVRPSNLKEIRSEIGDTDEKIHYINYSLAPISLKAIVDETLDYFNEFLGYDNDSYKIKSALNATPSTPIQCSIMNLNKENRKASILGKSSSLDLERKSISQFEDTGSTFNYSVEVQRSELKKSKYQPEEEKKNFLFSNKKIFLHKPCLYNITLHPPLIIENLLPLGGEFELFNTVDKTLLWSRWLHPGQVVPIHTLDLTKSISLSIYLYHCSTPPGGVLIHKPKRHTNASRDADPGKIDIEAGLLGMVHDMKTFIQDNVTGDLGFDSSIMPNCTLLVDGENQKMKLQIENTLGKGGERHIVLFMPFWVVNTSQYAIKMRQEGSIDLPAGSISAIKDGSKCLDRVKTSENWQGYIKSRINSDRPQTIYFGQKGQLHFSEMSKLSNDSELRGLLFGKLSFDNLVDIAYMFNYDDENIASLIGSHNIFGRRVNIQLDESVWSHPFSLDLVGVHQTISIYHNPTFDRRMPEGGTHEISYIINQAEGRLGKYTKILRFTPRLILINKLPIPVKIVPPPGYFIDKESFVAIDADHTRPFHIPLVFGGRQVSLQIEGPWVRTPSFMVDQFGTHSINLNRIEDFTDLKGTLTRDKPEYTIILPKYGLSEDGRVPEIGITFETDWSHQNIIVKKIKPSSWASGFDIQVGDVLLEVNHVRVAWNGDNGMYKDDMIDFEGVMSLIKSGFKTSPSFRGPLLKFRTVEESIRLIRMKATHSKQKETSLSKSASSMEWGSISELPLKLEIKAVDASILLLISQLPESFVDYPLANKIENAQFVIKNELPNQHILYKQKGADNSHWRSLGPCLQRIFMWDNPFIQKILIMKIGKNILSPNLNSDIISNNLFENNTAIIDLNLIGTKYPLQVDENHFENTLIHAKVDSEGPNKILIVEIHNYKSLMSDLKYSSEFIEGQLENLNLMKKKLTQSTSQTHLEVILLKSMAIKNIESVQKSIMDRFSDQFICSHSEFKDLFEPSISNVHQMSVEILEAKELKSVIFGRMEDVYCKLYIKSWIENKKMRGKPYFTSVCENTLDPKWIDQKFIFTIPSKALENNQRFYSIRIVVKSKAFLGLDNSLGQADISFTCKGFKEEEVVEGWFPLHIRKSALAFQNSLDTNRGYIKLKCRWIHTDRGLVESFKQDINQRLETLSLLNQQHKFLKKNYWTSGNTLDDSSVENEISTIKFANSFKNALNSAMYLLSSKSFKVRSVSKSFYSLNSAHINDLENHQNIPLRKRSFTSESGFSKASSSHKTSNRVSFDDSDEETDEVDENQHEINNSMNKLPQYHPHIEKKIAESTKLHFTTVVKIINKRRSIANHLTEESNNEKEKEIEGGTEAASCNVIKSTSDMILTYWDHFNTSLQKSLTNAFKLVHTIDGIAEILPIEVMNVPVGGPVYIAISYYHNVQSTYSIPPANKLLWQSEDFSDYDVGSYALKKSLYIDTYNIRGPIRVSVMQVGVILNTELAFVEIPIFRFIECTSNLNQNQDYDRYFPLGIPNNTTDQGNTFSGILNSYTEKSDVNDFGIFNNQPSIRLKLRWKPERFNVKYSDPAAAAAPSAVASAGDSTSQTAVSNHDHTMHHHHRSKQSLSHHPPSKSVNYFHFRIKCVSLSVIENNIKQEIMELTVGDIDLRQSSNESKTNFCFNVDHLQLDNHLSKAVVPVILTQKRVRYMQPIIKMHALYNKNTSHINVDCYETIELVVQELDLKLEQQTIIVSWVFVNHLLQQLGSSKFSSSVSKFGFQHLSNHSNSKLFSSDSVYNGDGNLPTTHIENIENNTQDPNFNEKKLYIDSLLICLIKINISFVTTPDSILSSVSEGINPDDVKRSFRSNNNRDLFTSFSSFLNRVGEVVLGLTTSISDAPITLSGKEIRHFFGNIKSNELISTLQQHYLSSALGQLLKIVGSLDLVGNPVGLMSSLGTGVRDLFYEPANAIMNKESLGTVTVSTIKGAISMISNTADGAIGTATTMTRFVGKGFAAFSMDQEFIDNREALSKKPEGYFNFFIRPLVDIGNGIYCGSVGLIRVPYNHVKKQGLRDGLVHGIPMALFGVLAKPIVGALDAATHAGEIGQNIAKYISSEYFPPPSRKRFTILFGPDGRLLRYDTISSLGRYACLEAKERSLDALGGMESVITDGINIIQDIKDTSKSIMNQSIKIPGRGYSTTLLPTSSIASSSDNSTTKSTPPNILSYLSFWKTDSKSNLGHKNSPQNYEKFDEDPTQEYPETYIYTCNFIRNHTIHSRLTHLVVISTLRVVLIECKQDTSEEGVDFKELWACNHDSISNIKLADKCSLEISSFSKDTNNHGRNSPTSNETRARSNSIHGKFTILCNFLEQSILLRCHNLLQAIQGKLDEIVPFEDKDIYEDEEWTSFIDSGYVRYGSWNWVPQPNPNAFLDKRTTLLADTENVLSDNTLLATLNNLNWVNPSSSKTNDDPSSQQFPRWQLEAQKMFLKAHEIYKYNNRNRNVNFADTKITNDTTDPIITVNNGNGNNGNNNPESIDTNAPFSNQASAFDSFKVSNSFSIPKVSMRSSLINVNDSNKVPPVETTTLSIPKKRQAISKASVDNYFDMYSNEPEEKSQSPISDASDHNLISNMPFTGSPLPLSNIPRINLNNSPLNFNLPRTTASLTSTNKSNLTSLKAFKLNKIDSPIDPISSTPPFNISGTANTNTKSTKLSTAIKKFQRPRLSVDSSSGKNDLSSPPQTNSTNTMNNPFSLKKNINSSSLEEKNSSISKFIQKHN